jgi:hypothetical protein
MESKNSKPNGGNVVASNLNNVNFFWEILNIEFKRKYHMLFFLKDVMSAQKIKFFILFASLTNIEWIKASHVDTDIFYNEKKN